MVLIQLYLIWLKPSPDETTDLNVVSTALSLFNVCWALASFSKNIRRQNVHKLVLTWLGVIFQCFWRLGTVTSRVVALSVYATVYTYWVFVVILLHWFSMLMWLISPKNVFHGEKMSTLKKVAYSTLIALVYVFCYINIQESNSRQKLLIFYVTMFLENTLLFSVWLIAARTEEFWFRQLATTAVFAGFLVGIAFMCLYYRYFHVRKLSYAYETGTSSTYRESRSSSVLNGNEYISSNYEKYGQDNLGLDASLRAEIRRAAAALSNHDDHQQPQQQQHHRHRNAKMTSSVSHHIHHPNVPGVFNCRFHPAIKRKKKKPTSFIPPPAVQQRPQQQRQHQQEQHSPEHDEEQQQCQENLLTEPFISSPNNKTHPTMMMMNNLVNSGGKMSHPFWKRPLSITMVGSENEGSVGSRVDIQQKLQEKKQQQLAELREIEEEIKQGKLKRPHISEIPEPVINERQPMPFEKKQPWFRADPPIHLSPRPPITIPRPSDNNELILHPTFLMYANTGNNCLSGAGGPAGTSFYHHPGAVVNNEPDDDDSWNYYEPLYQNEDLEANLNIRPSNNSGGGGSSSANVNNGLKKTKGSGQSRENMYKSYRIPSDIDSQMSLPRSYTLPREFKCRRKMRKPVKTENFLPSTNSSDGKFFRSVVVVSSLCFFCF